MLLLSYIREEEGRPEVLKGYEEEISRSNTPAFHWPPKPPSEEEERIALAAPIYVAPPETQHIQPKPRGERMMLPPSAQSVSAPQLAIAQGRSDVSMMSSEQPEIYSDNSASTSTSTGDSSSEDYQVYSTNVSQQVVRYFDQPAKSNPINAAVNYASNYAEMLRHKPSICSVGADSYVSDNGYENEMAYVVREPSEPKQYEPEESQKKGKRVGFAMPAEEVNEEREGSLSREFRRASPVSAEGRHGPLYPNTVQIQHDMDSYYQERRESNESGYQYEQEMDRRQSYASYDDSRRESEVTAEVEDKTLPFTQQYCSGDTARFALPKLEETKPCPLPNSPNVNSLPQQWQSQMLKALTTTPKEVEKDMDDPFERARQAAYEQQIEDDRKARDNERRKLMDEMLAKQRAMRERQERNEQDQARRFAPVSKLAPRTPDNWRPPQPTPTIPLPEEKTAYIPEPPSMEPIRIGPLTFPRMESPLLDALKTASIRPYTPFSNEVASQLMDLPRPCQQMTFSSALVTAPDRPFTPHNEQRDYNASPIPYTPAPDYSQMPTKIYKENEEQIRYLEQEVEQRLERGRSAFAKIRAVKPATPVLGRRSSSNMQSNGRMDFPFTEDQIPQVPQPIVCRPQECLSTYESMCSVQQRSYSQGQDAILQQQRQQERLRQMEIQQHQQMQLERQQQERTRYQQQQRQSQGSIRGSQTKLPPPHPSARVPSSPRRVQSQAQSPVLLKPDPAGLHKADDIPGYQRKWFNLPSQRASITPEPHELKENVPLAFVAAPKEPSPTISKPIAISAANTYTTSFATLSSSTSAQSNSYSKNSSYESQYYQQQQQQILPGARKLLAIEPRYSITESQPIVVTAAPVEKQNEEVVVEEEKPAPKTEEGGISGKPYNVQNVTQPKRGRGILNQAAAGRSPMCGCCGGQVRGPFITALGRIWCPEHFICVNANCKRPLADIGFVEEKGDLYCEYCFEQYLAPNCSKCTKKIKGDCLNAIGKQFHPECFTCSHCGKLFGNSPFFLEEGEPFCQNDWNQLFTTKCFACGFPVEAGDRWVEALNNNYHSQCFNCTMCKKNLEGQSFYAKGGRPFCKNHAR